MKEAPVLTVSVAVEGRLDMAVMCRVLAEAGCQPGTIYGLKGKAFLRERLAGYNRAAERWPWCILVDLDYADCAPRLIAEWLPQPAALMCFRVAVREVESWLMADAEQLSLFLGVSARDIPSDTESLADPKEAMVSLARRSDRREIREAMVPRPASGRGIGPAYALRLSEFTQTMWRPRVAAEACRSVSKCMNRIEEMCQRLSRQVG